MSWNLLCDTSLHIIFIMLQYVLFSITSALAPDATSHSKRPIVLFQGEQLKGEFHIFNCKKNYKNSELNSIWPTFSKRSLWCGLRSERNYPRNVIKQQYPARTQREWTFSGGGARFPWKTSKFCLFADLAHCWNFNSKKNNWKSNVLTLKTRVTAWSTVIQLVLDSNVLEEYCFGFFCCDS